MRHRKLRSKLGVKSQHRVALLRNLARGLVAHKRITTTVAKAKEASAYVDGLVTVAKRGGLHARRLLISKVRCPDTAKLLMDQIAPLFKDRNGGYTRILRLGTHRPGDASERAVLEFSVLVEQPKKPKKIKKTKKAAEQKEEPATGKPKKAESPAKPEQASGKAGETAKGESEKKPAVEKKESEKKGGFLGALRKFLKGDES